MRYINRLLFIGFVITIVVGSTLVALQGCSQSTIIPIDPGEETIYLGPHLWGLLQRQASGDKGVPDSLSIGIGYYTDTESALLNAIEDAGGIAKDEYVWEIPVDKVLPIIQRPDVYHAELAQPEGEETIEPQMNQTLSDVAIAYRAGISKEEAVQYALFSADGALAVWLVIPDSNTADRVRAWLNSRDILIAPREVTTDYDMGVWLPAPQIDPLAQAFPDLYMEAEDLWGQGLPLLRSYWPQETLEWEQSIVATIKQASK